MSEIKLGLDELRYISLFESVARASVKDCLIDGDRVTMVVKTGDMGLAIGRNGDTVKKAEKLLGRHVEVIEYSDNVNEFIKNVLSPIVPKRIAVSKRSDKRIAYVEVPTKDKGLVIGRNGKNIEKVKMLLHRHHDINDVVIQ